MGGSGGAVAAGARSPRRRGSAARAPLSRDEVVETALRLIDEQGFYELSMRGLARELGVFPAAVYWHAGTKSEVLALVSERVLSEIELPDVDDADWRTWMLELGMRSRAVLGRHPRFVSYFITHIQVSARSLVLTDRVLDVLYGAGFRGEDLIEAYNALFGAAFSWTAGEFAEEDVTSTREEITKLVEEAEPGSLQRARALWPLVANRVYGLRWSSGADSPMDSSFERMLRTLIDGFAARLSD